MKCVTLDELSADPMLAELRDGEQEIVVTAHGKPMALLVRVTSDDLTDTLLAVRQVRAQAAATRIRERARRAGTDALGSAEIDEEIRVIRAARSPE